MQKAIIVGSKYGDTGLVQLNLHLEGGWTVVSNRPMGGAAAGGGTAMSSEMEFKSLVIVEKEDE